MKQFILIFAVLGIVQCGYTQSDRLDSLSSILDTKITTKHKVDVLNEINKITLSTHDSIAIDQVHEAIRLSNKIDYNLGLGTSYYYLGQYLFGIGSYDSAITIQMKSLSIHEDHNKLDKIRDNYLAIGDLHNFQSNYATALSYFIKSLGISEQLSDSINIARSYDNIAIVHKYQGNLDNAIDFFSKSLAIRESLGDDRRIANSLNNIGIIYRIQGNYEKARSFYINSLVTKVKLEDKVGISNAYNNIGITHFFEKDYDKALEYYFKSLTIRESLQNKGDLPSTYLNIGEAYTYKNNFEKGEEYLHRALKSAILTGNKDDQMLTYEVMALLDKKQGKYADALENMTKYIELKDEIYNEANNEKIAELQAKYEIDKTERELKLLQKENEIIGMQKENDALIRNILIFVTIIISILVFAIMRSYWGELANTKLLKTQKEEIENRNKVLKDLSYEKDQLMRIVAHDLRSPLNQVEGLVKLISFERENLSDQQTESMKRIIHAVDHSKELLSKILSARSLDSAELKLNLEKVDIKSILSGVVKDYELAANKKKIDIRVDMSNEDTFNVMADKNYTEQVIDNLLSNAIKFSPLEEKIDISLVNNHTKVLLEFKDNGPGINDDEKKNLFGKYQKLSAQPTGGETSTGLGLSIVKKYVEIMNGKVWYEKNEEQGSKFVVELEKA